MQLKKTFLTLLFLALFAIPAFGQDAGTPDTVDLVVSLNPDANANQLNVEVQLWVYNDAGLQASGMGFSWDNPNLQLDSTVTTALGGSWQIGPFFYENNSLATTNANQRFLFGGVAIFSLFSGDATGRRHWATYYFTLSNWSTTDEINIDTLEFNAASVFLLVSGIGGVYQPIWTGALKITDPNAPSPNQPFVDVDIKPQSCPNPLNVKNKGVIPVAVLGSAEFDISQIDAATVELEGVSSDGRTLTPEDVATPFEGELCECHTRAGDGFTDQVFMFDAQAIVAALGEVTNNEERELTLTGSLLDGTPFQGSDCVRIKKGPRFGFVLNNNFPNPFNPTTQISYSLPTDAYVQLDIFNIRGQNVKTLVDQRQTAGVHNIVWDGRDNTGRSVSSGIYFYRIQAGDVVITKRMTLLK